MQDDIVYRLRTEVVWEQEVGELLSDAAREIERLRPAYATAVQRLASEIERLRLTDAERVEIAALAEEMETLAFCYGEDDLCRKQWEEYGSYARLLTAILKRTE